MTYLGLSLLAIGVIYISAWLWWGFVRQVARDILSLVEQGVQLRLDANRQIVELEFKQVEALTKLDYWKEERGLIDEGPN